MAQVPYSEGVNSVEPQVQAPNDYQNISTSPNQFGAGIGEGLKELGQGMSVASKFYGQVAADNVSNNFQEQVDKLLHGDPNKTTIGPDGQPVQDIGYLGLKGRAALDARPATSSAIDEALKNARAQLTSPEQQLQFDNFSRRYRSMAMGQMGTHADQQANQWYNQVNKDTEVLAIGHIAANADDPELVKHGTEDLISARVKNAQLQGAQPGDSVYNAAVVSGKRDALIAQVNSIGVKDPARAAKLLDEPQNKELAGALYDNVANALRTRANAQVGQEVGAQKVKEATEAAANPSLRAPATPGTSSVPVDKDGTPFEKSHTSVLFGHLENTNSLPQGYLGRTMQIESGGKDVSNPSGAAGYFQFMPGTARQFNVNPHDLVSSADGAARLASKNAQVLRLGLGRAPTGGELYLAHQQGAGGAVKLLSNPNALASDVVGIKAVLQNGGTQGMTAGQFANLWINNYNGAKPGTVNPTSSLPSSGAMPYATPGLTNADLLSLSASPGADVSAAPAAPTVPEAPAAPTSPAAPAAPVQPISLKADAYQRVMSDPSLNYEQRAHALQYVSQTLQAQQIAADADEKAKRRASDEAADKVVQMAYSGDITGATALINGSTTLEWRTREALHNLVLAQGGDDTGKATATYGPGFWDTYKKVTAPIGDPDRISDPVELMERAGPGGDLTLAGVKELTGALMTGRKSVDDQAVQTTKASLIQYAKGKISYQEELYPGGPIRRDQKGEAIFQGQFIPKFMAAYDQWQKDGKDPWQFLTRDNVDKLAEGMRPAAQMARDKLADTEGAEGNAGTNPATPQPIPPAPANVDPAGWQSVMTALPPTPTGQPFPRASWAAAVQTLVADPSEKNIALFNSSKYGKGGFNGKEILDALKTGEPLKPKQPVAIIAPSDRENAEFIKDPAFNVLNSMGP